MTNSQHPISDERWSAYLDGQLSPEESAQLQQRLATDEAARRALDELRQLRESLQALPRPTLGRSFTDRVMMQVRDLSPNDSDSLLSSSSTTTTADRKSDAASESSLPPLGPSSPSSTQNSEHAGHSVSSAGATDDAISTGNASPWRKRILWAALAMAASVMVLLRAPAPDRTQAVSQRPPATDGRKAELPARNEAFPEPSALSFDKRSDSAKLAMQTEGQDKANESPSTRELHEEEQLSENTIGRFDELNRGMLGGRGGGVPAPPDDRGASVLSQAAPNDLTDAKRDTDREDRSRVGSDERVDERAFKTEEKSKEAPRLSGTNTTLHDAPQGVEALADTYKSQVQDEPVPAPMQMPGNPNENSGQSARTNRWAMSVAGEGAPTAVTEEVVLLEAEVSPDRLPALYNNLMTRQPWSEQAVRQAQDAIQDTPQDNPVEPTDPVPAGFDEAHFHDPPLAADDARAKDWQDSEKDESRGESDQITPATSSTDSVTAENSDSGTIKQSKDDSLYFGVIEGRYYTPFPKTPSTELALSNYHLQAASVEETVKDVQTNQQPKLVWFVVDLPPEAVEQEVRQLGRVINSSTTTPVPLNVQQNVSQALVENKASLSNNYFHYLPATDSPAETALGFTASEENKREEVAAVTAGKTSSQDTPAPAEAAHDDQQGGLAGGEKAGNDTDHSVRLRKQETEATESASGITNQSVTNGPATAYSEELQALQRNLAPSRQQQLPNGRLQNSSNSSNRRVVLWLRVTPDPPATASPAPGP